MYIDGFVAAVPKSNKEAYIKHLEEITPVLKEFGVSRMVDAWQDDVPKGKVTDFFRAVDAKEDEVVVFSWFEWPSKGARDEGMKRMMSDERMKNLEMPFDGKRVIFGGFNTIYSKNF